MGTVLSLSALSTSWQVTSAATSDEPYRLMSFVCGSCLRNSAASSTGSVSPLHTQYRKDARRCARGSRSSSITRNSDGTKTSRVTLLSASARTKLFGSLTTSSGMMTSGTPCNRGPKISQSESTKLREVFWQQTSSAAKG